jgi:Xaa-Pro aminopeptidase
LSEEVPEETIRKLEALLRQQGKELDEDLKTMTVKQIVKSIMAFLSESIVTEETAEDVIIEKACRNLKMIINDIEIEKSQSATAQSTAPHVPVSSSVDFTRSVIVLN